MDNDPFVALRREWRQKCSTSEAERCYSALAASEPTIAACEAGTLAALVASLDRRDANSRADGWRLLATLIRRLETSELVGLGVLVALIPAMLRIAEDLYWGEGGPWSGRIEFLGDVLSHTWDVLSSLAGSTPEFPVQTIRRRVLGRLRRQRNHAIAGRQREIPTLFCEPEDAEERSGASAEVYRHALLADNNPVPVLDRLAVALCSVDPAVLDRSGVQVVYARRVLGYGVRELSLLLGRPENVVEYQAARAEALLCAS